MLKENTLTHIRYDKKGEVTERDVIVTYVPTPRRLNVKAIDVSDLPSEEAERMLNAWNEYQEYLENQRKTLFAFEDFVEQTTGSAPTIKWRTFKPDQLEEL